MKLERLIAEQLATPHKRGPQGQNACTVAANIMFTSGGENRSGPECILCSKKVNALLEANGPIHDLQPACMRRIVDACNVQRPACYAHERSSQEQNACTAAINVLFASGENVILCSQEENALGVNGPISAAVSVRPRPVWPAATAQSPRSTG